MEKLSPTWVVKVVAFDADDTLWVNEPYFQETEKHFCAILEDYLPAHTIQQELLKTEIQNMPLYGFGVKAFMLSMVETALRISEGHISAKSLERILALGKEMLEKPIELLPGVREVLEGLYGKFRLVVATKGDLLDQERKLKKSGLESFFHHIEIMSDKQTTDYQKLIRHLDIRPEEFLMIGNSIKSDVLPVLKIGGKAVHVPYHTTWQFEKTDEVAILDEHFRNAEQLTDVLRWFQD
jgi:putative hydrolase of the HAD superfamily